MKTKVYYFLSEVANLLMVWAFVISIGEFAMMVTKKDVESLFGLAVLVMLIGVYFIRTKVRNVILYFIVNIAFFIGCAFIPMGVSNLIFFIMIEVVMMFLNLWYYFSGKYYGLVTISVYVIVTFAIEFFWADISGMKDAMTLFFIYGMIFFLMNYLRMFFGNVHLLSGEKKKNTKMPYNEIVRNDSKIVLPFIFVSFLVMLILKVDFIDSWLAGIYMKLVVYVRYAIVWFVNFMEHLFDMLLGSEESFESFEMEMDMTQKTPSVFANILSNVILIIMIGVIVFLFARFLIRFFKAIESRKGYENKESIDETGMVEIRERISRKRVSKEKISPIRKQYKQTVEKMAKKGYKIHLNHTPNERVGHMKKEMKYDINELTIKYVNDRYSNNKQ